MSDDAHLNTDPVVATAWAWVVRQHENIKLDNSAQAELAQWLSEDIVHKQAYDKACRIWLIAGMVPPVGDTDIPDDSLPESD